MPKFVIVELLTERREIEAESASEALTSYLNGTEKLPVEYEVKDRWIEDEKGNYCHVEDAY